MKSWIPAIGLWVTASLGVAATPVPAIKVSPATVQMRASAKPASQTFTVTETGVTTPSTTFTWSLSSTSGATTGLGSIDTKGVYTPPAIPPAPNIVKVTVTDAANKLTTSATITLL